MRSSRVRVRSVRRDHFSKVVATRKREIRVVASRAVQPGDTLRITGRRIFKHTVDGDITLAPIYRQVRDLRIGGETARVRVTEPVTEDDWASVEHLRTYHYRARPPFGRQAVLILRCSTGSDPQEIAGLIEIGVAPICNTARDRTLDAPFSSRTAHWESWNYAARGSHCSRIAEITRVVVHPDYRGLGLSTLLMKEATLFAKDYWEAGGVRPLFCEIVADMLRYHGFAISAGFRYVGQTQGNLHRVAQDLRYMSERIHRHEGRQFHMESSVERMQWKYARFLAAQLSGSGTDLGWALRRLETLDRTSLLRHLSLFQEVVRLPKPVFMAGITPEAIRFISERSQSAPVVRNPPELRVRAQSELSPIVFDRVSVWRETLAPNSRAAKELCLSFGMRYPSLSESIFSLSASIPLGSVVLVSGRSGSGKSTLLQLLAGRLAPSSGRIAIPPGVRVAEFAAQDGQEALITLLGPDISHAVEALGSAGLAEPSVYLRPYRQLSEGQRERARLAGLMTSGANCWLIDDLGALLDPLSARVVSFRLSRLARARGATVFACTTREDEVRGALQPDLELHLNARRPVEIRSCGGSSGVGCTLPQPAVATPGSRAHG